MNGTRSQACGAAKTKSECAVKAALMPTAGPFRAVIRTFGCVYQAWLLCMLLARKVDVQCLRGVMGMESGLDWSGRERAIVTSAPLGGISSSFLQESLIGTGGGIVLVVVGDGCAHALKKRPLPVTIVMTTSSNFAISSRSSAMRK